tara:strand:- start:16 stop:489 length:474 start_codon:yes stop_codon:yes gene_type:complete
MKISEKELKQIIVEALEEQDLQEDRLDYLFAVAREIGKGIQNPIAKAQAAAKNINRKGQTVSMERDLRSLRRRIESIITKASKSGDLELISRLDEFLRELADRIEDTFDDVLDKVTDPNEPEADEPPAPTSATSGADDSAAAIRQRAMDALKKSDEL